MKEREESLEERIARDLKVDLELKAGKSLPDLELTVKSVPFEPGEKEFAESIFVVKHQVYICHCCDEAKMSKDVVGRYTSIKMEDVGPDRIRYYQFQNCDSCRERYTLEERKERSAKHRHYEYGILDYVETDLTGWIVKRSWER